LADQTGPGADSHAIEQASEFRSLVRGEAAPPKPAYSGAFSQVQHRSRVEDDRLFLLADLRRRTFLYGTAVLNLRAGQGLNADWLPNSSAQ
jgi:hypothetical protein